MNPEILFKPYALLLSHLRRKGTNHEAQNYIKVPITMSVLQYFLYDDSKQDFDYFSLQKIRFTECNSQWSNLTLARQFWETKVGLQASKTSKMCLFGRPTGRATF